MLEKQNVYLKNLVFDTIFLAMIPIHHMEAHALTPRLTNNLEFPYLTFLISGGHCMLALAQVFYCI